MLTILGHWKESRGASLVEHVPLVRKTVLHVIKTRPETWADEHKI